MSADDAGPTPPAAPAEPGTGPRRRRRRRGRRSDMSATTEAPSAAPGAPRAPRSTGGPLAPRSGDPRRSDPRAPHPPRDPHAPRPARDPADPRGRRRGRHGAKPGGPTPRTVEPAPPVVPPVSHLAESGPASEPLRADEIEEMKEHLAFLREYKDALRLRLNAAEDLLVNGRREPSDRGVCRHLLGKVDRSVIEAAAGREPLKSNPVARARMLAGAIRLTADVGVLLAYLETLTAERSHAEAAQAFAEVVRRIDFESLSATRLARLLQVLTETFQGQERVQVLFSLLAGDAFRRAFDAAETMLPSEVTAIFAPLRAVHRRLLGEPGAAGDAHDARDRLAVGLEQVMAAPDPVLRGYGEPLRIRMLELALDPGIPPALADRAAGVLLTSLIRTGKTFTRLAMRRAAQLLARHVDDRARATLEEVKRAAPGFHAAERWLAALDARRMGRIALTAPPPERGRLGMGFWLDGQRPVWLRTASITAAESVASEAKLQAGLALPGVAPVVEHGVTSGIPYVALAVPGQLGQPWQLDDAAPVELVTALALAAQAARILRALALAGVVLPDAETERFCISGERAPALTLVDLDGAHTATIAEAHVTAGQRATALVRRLLPFGRLPAEDDATVARALAGADLVALVHALDGAMLHTRREV